MGFDNDRMSCVPKRPYTEAIKTADKDAIRAYLETDDEWWTFEPHHQNETWAKDGTILHHLYDYKLAKDVDLEFCAIVLDVIKSTEHVQLLTNTPNSYGELPIHVLCAREADIVSVEMLQQYIDFAGDRSTLWKQTNGALPLHYVCNRSGNVDMIRLLCSTDEEKARVGERGEKTDFYNNFFAHRNAIDALCSGKAASFEVASLLYELDTAGKLSEPLPDPEEKDRIALHSLLFSGEFRTKPDLYRLVAKRSHESAALKIDGWRWTPLALCCAQNDLTVEELEPMLELDRRCSESQRLVRCGPENNMPLHYYMAGALYDDLSPPSKPHKPAMLSRYLDDNGVFSDPFKKLSDLSERDQKDVSDYGKEVQRYQAGLKRWEERLAERKAQRPKINPQVITVLLEGEGAKVLFEKDNRVNMMPILYAAQERGVELITPMLEAAGERSGELLRQKTDKNETAAMIARRNGDFATLAALEGLSGTLLRKGKPEEMLLGALLGKRAAVVSAVVSADPRILKVSLGEAHGHALNVAIATGYVQGMESVLELCEDRLDYVRLSLLGDYDNCLMQAIVQNKERIALKLLDTVPDIYTLITEQALQEAAIRNGAVLRALIAECTEHKVDLLQLCSRDWNLSARDAKNVYFPKNANQLCLHTIDLSNNALRDFPNSLLNIKSLRNVSLARNRIKELDRDAIVALRRFSLQRLSAERQLRKRKGADTEPTPLHLSLKYNRLRVVPPELYGLGNVRVDTSSNPLAGSWVFPAWFFGISYTRFNLVVLDLLFLVLAAAILMCGTLFMDSERVRYAMFVFIALFFGCFVCGASYFGLFGIAWTDSLVAHLHEADDDESDDEDADWEGAEAEGDADGMSGGGAGGDGGGAEVPDADADVEQLSGGDGTRLEAGDGGDAGENGDIGRELVKSLATVMEDFEDPVECCGSLANILAVVALVIETPTVLAFSFQVDVPWPEEFKSIFSVFLFDFEFLKKIYADVAEQADAIKWHVGLWLAVTLVIVQRLLLELSRFPNVARFSATFLQTGIAITMLPIFTQLAKSFDCDYSAGIGAGVDGAYVPARLDDYSSRVCWETEHLVYAGVSLLAFMLFYPMAILSVPIWQHRSKGLSVKWPSYFMIVSGQLKLVLALLTAFFTRAIWFYLIVNVVMTIGLLLLVATVRTPLLSPLNPNFVPMYRTRVARLGAYAAAVMTAIGAIVTFVLDDDALGLIVLLSLAAVDLAIALTCAVVMLRARSIQKKRRAEEMQSMRVAASKRVQNDETDSLLKETETAGAPLLL